MIKKFKVIVFTSACVKACAIFVNNLRYASKTIFFIILCFCFALPGFAQLEVVPHYHPAKANPITVSSANRTARLQADTLTLPFFEDFSTYSPATSRPDTNLWQADSGVVVNNTIAINPPSTGVVTLDGLSFKGRAYDFTTQLSQISTDTLTSKGINLTGLDNAGVYLSFFWQTQGLGEAPDATDSLILEFKDRDTVWQRISTYRGQIMADFKQEIIAVNSPGFFHSGFQFRFRAFGRPSGAYDSWHIDYVYLNSGRSADDIYVFDVAVTNPLRSLLQNYTAMPLEQYLADPAGQLITESRTSIYNLQFRGIFAPYTYTIRNLAGNEAPYQFSKPVAEIPVGARERQEIAAPVPADLVSRFSGRPLILQQTFTISADNNTAPIPGVDLTRNDTISGTTVLNNYYAYDDGTAEYGVGIRQRQGRVACKYYVNTPDTITAVQVYFTQLENNQSGQTFVLRVWNKLDEQESSVLYEKSEPIKYADTLNRFITYELSSPVVVTDTFYIGWQQSTNDLLAVGLDKNTNSGNQLFYNTAGQWESNTEVQGSAMIRPVFGRAASPVGVDDELEEQINRSFAIFPNPASNSIHWEYPEVSQIKVYNLLGQQIAERRFAPADKGSMDVSSFPDGIYLLHITIKNRTVVTKIFVQR